MKEKLNFICSFYYVECFDKSNLAAKPPMIFVL